MKPTILPYNGALPDFAAEPDYCGPRAAVLGRVRLGGHAWLGGRSVMRGDGHEIVAGTGLYLGPHATVHIAHSLYPALIGDRVAVGTNAVIHACTVGDDCVVEDEVVILDGSVVEAGVVIAAGSTVFQQSRLQAGQLYAGSPAKLVRPLAAGEAVARGAAIRARGEGPADATLPQSPANLVFGPEVFIAATVALGGRIVAEEGANIWFGCDLDGGSAGIVIGRNSNIQDNSTLRAVGATVTIGADSTIGHNVELVDCTIGARVLIGIGSRVAAGTLIGDDVLLGAGATTLPGQVLEGGWFHGGRPARPIAKLDDKKRNLIAGTIGHYRHYAAAFARAQADK